MTDAKNGNLKEIIVHGTKLGQFTQAIVVNNHVLIADEPIANGGNDLGPSPSDFILAGLGACTSMTLRMYAQYNKIPLEKIVVKLKHEKVHAQDCAECENKDVKIDRIDRSIELYGDLNQKQRDKLLEIANKCPVHRTLTSTITIVTKLADVSS